MHHKMMCLLGLAAEVRVICKVRFQQSGQTQIADRPPGPHSARAGAITSSIGSEWTARTLYFTLTGMICMQRAPLGNFQGIAKQFAASSLTLAA